ncbi:MAG: FmdB family zinc ribbon protein [Pyrinomonadaceae bacterium]
MPIYEYTCRKCGAHVEALQKVTDKPLVKCKQCGGRLEKQWSQTGFQFKGTGWYVTDYAKKGADAKGDGAEAKSETKTDAKSDSKADTKPDAKTDSAANTAKGGGEKKTPKATSTSKSASKD